MTKGGGEPKYLLDSDDEPLRLELQARLYDVERDVRRLAPSPDAQVLDAGCGSGAMTRAIARAVPRGHVTGIDREPRFLQFARRQAAADAIANITFDQGDLYSLPFASSTFDLVWSKHVLQWLREPRRALEEFRRVTRPGGRVVSCNFDGVCLSHYPVDLELQQDLELWFREAANRLGFDALIGRKLYSLFHQAGLVHVKAEFEPDRVFSGGGPLTPDHRKNWELQLQATMDFTAEVFGSRERAEDFWRRFLAHIDRDDTYSFCALFYVEGSVP